MRRRSDDSNKLLYDPNQRMQQRLGTFSMDENSDEEINDEEVKSDVEGFSESNKSYENIQNSSFDNNDVDTSNNEEKNNQSLVKKAAKNVTQQLGNQVKKVVSNVASKVALKIGAFIAANPWVLLIIGGVAALFLLIIIFASLTNSNTGNSGTLNGEYGIASSSCNTSSDEANLITFIFSFEGETTSCDNDNGYLAVSINDGAITAGHGVTNAAISSAGNFIEENNFQEYFNRNNSGVYYMNIGDCIPKDVVDKISVYVIENDYASTIDSVSEKYGVTLTQFQKDAITSFNYNLGTGYTEDIIKAYADGGYSGLWDEMSKYFKGYDDNGNLVEYDGLKKRRKAEFALFVTGDYTDQGLFYGRDLNNYENYDSEGVIAREAVCSGASESGLEVTPDGYIARLTRPLRSNGYFYDQSSSQQLAYTDYEGECSWYAGHRAKEILATMGIDKQWNSMPNGNAYCSVAEVNNGTFRKSTNVNEPKVGALISWTGGDYGHVAVVEQVNSDGSIVISEASISNGIVPDRATLHKWYDSMGGTRLARKYNCESNGKGCFKTTTISKDRINGYVGAFGCYIYLID